MKQKKTVDREQRRKLQRYITQAQEHQKSIKRRQQYLHRRFAGGKISYIDYAQKYEDYRKKHQEYNEYMSKTHAALEHKEKTLRITGNMIIAFVLAMLLLAVLSPVVYQTLNDQTTELQQLFRDQFLYGGITAAAGFSTQGFSIAALPTIDSVILNSTFGTNLTTENLTVYTDQDDNSSLIR
ncbi:MAG: hypothetical protein IH932_02885 [Thaumarchaeota archaeon]|nr:hypothetical protein [Nitrososphaerota archaeon]